MAAQPKKKTRVSTRKPSANKNKATEDENVRLLKLITKHKRTVKNLESQVSDLKLVKESRDALLTEVDTLSENKKQLSIFVSQNSSKQEAFKKILAELNKQKKEIDTYIEKQRPKKDTLKSELLDLESRKEAVNQDIENLKASSSEIQSAISDLHLEKEEVKKLICELNDEYGLYPRDMKNVSRDSKRQLKTYSLLAGASGGVSLVLAMLLIRLLTVSNPFVERMMSFFNDQPNFQFYSMLTMTLAIIAVFAFLITLSLNLTRKFVSHYINVRNRLTTLRVADFLLARLERTESKSKSGKGDQNQEFSNLVNKYIPMIMDFSNSPLNGKASKQKAKA